MDYYIRCNHCAKLMAPGEIEDLTKEICPILMDNEIYQICEYCLGLIEGRFGEEKEYWNKWVKEQRVKKDKSDQGS